MALLRLMRAISMSKFLLVRRCTYGRTSTDHVNHAFSTECTRYGFVKLGNYWIPPKFISIRFRGLNGTNTIRHTMMLTTLLRKVFKDTNLMSDIYECQIYTSTCSIVALCVQIFYPDLINKKDTPQFFLVWNVLILWKIPVHNADLLCCVGRVSWQ